MAFLGFLIAKGFLFPLGDIIIFFILVVSFLALGYGVNDCFDVKEDKYRKDRINPLVNKEISFKTGLIFSISPGIFGLVLSTIYGWRVFLFCLVGVIIGFFYSAPPLRLKGRPVLDLISHGFFAGVFWFVLPLFFFKTELNLFHYLISFSIFYFFLVLELRNHLEDFESDKKADIKTFVCAFGPGFSEKLLQYLTVIFPLTIFPVFLLVFPKYLFLFLVFSLFFLFSFQFFVRRLKTEKSYKIYRIIDIYAFSFFGLSAVFSAF